MSTRSANGRNECAALCTEDCLFLKYEDNGSGLGKCDLYTLWDTVYASLKFVNVANLYKKVYPPANVFVGISEENTWYEASNFCQSQGGKLAIADSTAKVDRMVSLMGSGKFWVGGWKNGKTWQWVSGAVVKPAPENDDIGAECLWLYYRKLSDWYCGRSFRSVCEFQF